MGLVKASVVLVTFTQDNVTDPEKHGFMNELVRLLIFRMKQTVDPAELADSCRFRWYGVPNDPLRYGADVIGPHDSEIVREVVANMALDALDRNVPVTLNFHRP